VESYTNSAPSRRFRLHSRIRSFEPRKTGIGKLTLNCNIFKGTQAVRIEFFVDIKSCQYLMFYANKMSEQKARFKKSARMS
jgi:hypothetical protein